MSTVFYRVQRPPFRHKNVARVAGGCYTRDVKIVPLSISDSLDLEGLLVILAKTR